MFPIGQIALGLVQLVKMLLSLNVILGIALLGAVVHTAPVSEHVAASVDSGGHFVFNSNYTVLTDSLDEGPRKQVYEIRPIIPAYYYKFHFIFALLMFFFVALIVVSPSVTVRALLLLPVVLAYGASHVLFACDQAEMVDGMMARYRRRVSKAPGGEGPPM
ncbi:hypothetical protein L0Y65_06810 [Candidatus Micrarchaeota archaeon]|nr:hypothetical protein [Candidatus Micrarchaeota archaeon]